MKQLLALLTIIAFTYACEKSVGEHISDEGADAINETFFDRSSIADTVFNGSEGEFITQQEFWDRQDAWLAQASDTTIWGFYIGRDVLDQLLAQPDAQGIRMSFIIDPDSLDLDMAFSAANSSGNNFGENAGLAYPYPCCNPWYCPPGNCKTVLGKEGNGHN